MGSPLPTMNAWLNLAMVSARKKNEELEVQSNIPTPVADPETIYTAHHQMPSKALNYQELYHF